MEIIKPVGDLQLKPCPFCGSDEVVYMKYQTVSGERYKVFCCGCTASIDTGWHISMCQPQELWNKRV